MTFYGGLSLVSGLALCCTLCAFPVLHSVCVSCAALCVRFQCCTLCFLCCTVHVVLCVFPGLQSCTVHRSRVALYFPCFTLCVLCVQKLAKLVEEEKLREEAGFYDFSSEDEAEKELEAQLAKYVRLSGYLPSTAICPAGTPLSPPTIPYIHFVSCPQKLAFFSSVRQKQVCYWMFFVVAVFHHIICPFLPFFFVYALVTFFLFFFPCLLLSINFLVHIQAPFDCPFSGVLHLLHGIDQWL